MTKRKLTPAEVRAYGDLARAAARLRRAQRRAQVEVERDNHEPARKGRRDG